MTGARIDKFTPDEWQERTGVRIMDPDGWRKADAPAWTEPITRGDFLTRACMSTVMRWQFPLLDAGNKWEHYPARQLTGKPYVYHAYVGRHGQPEETCGHDHRRPQRAVECAKKLARSLNRAEGFV